MSRRLYFAYGSNLNIGQLLRRCPAAEPVGRHTLEDYRLVMRGVADIVPARGECVEGAVYTITPRCEQALDRYEGWPHLYRKELIHVMLRRARRRVAAGIMVYRMNDDETLAPPSPGYLATILEGYNDWQIPPATLTAAVRAAYEGVTV